MNRLLSREKSLQLWQHLRDTGQPTTYDAEKHRIILLDQYQNEVVQFRLPLVFPELDKMSQVQNSPVHYIILLIQSGSCAMGYFENGQNLDHKVFRAYMVRMKQGKSQVKYLKTKGKSRAGSRVRLAETVEFFENINARLQQYFAGHPIQRIALSCSKILIPYLFNAKEATSFDKKDRRILKIPRHIPTPTYEVLLKTNKYLLKGELIYEDSQQPIIDALVHDIGGY